MVGWYRLCSRCQAIQDRWRAARLRLISESQRRWRPRCLMDMDPGTVGRYNVERDAEQTAKRKQGEDSEFES